MAENQIAQVNFVSGLEPHILVDFFWILQNNISRYLYNHNLFPAYQLIWIFKDLHA